METRPDGRRVQSGGCYIRGGKALWHGVGFRVVHGAAVLVISDCTRYVELSLGIINYVEGTSRERSEG